MRITDNAVSGPTLTIDLKKIEHNTRTIVSLCRRHNIEVVGVTKATCGMPEVAGAMLRGGVAGIGESRLKNIQRLRDASVKCPMMLLRIPPLSLVDEIVETVDISLNSELSVIRGLADAARKKGRVHKLILMVDLGDLREGIWPDDLIPFTRAVAKFPGVAIVGIGTNLTCYGGVIPSPENMRALVEYARMIEQTLARKLRYISGGNSSGLPLLAAGKMPRAINHFRIGEAILLGRETVYRQAWPGTFQDAFILTAEIIELKQKPSRPIGKIGTNAFGKKPVFENRGYIFRAILNVGRGDVSVEGLTPLNPDVTILGASSDHLIVDVTNIDPPPRLGDSPGFKVNYAALVGAMSSAYVEKIILPAEATKSTA